MPEREKFEKWYAETGSMFVDMEAYWWECWQAALAAAPTPPTQPEIDVLKAEVKHWKANHENMVNRSRVLIDRPDLPLERVQAFRQIERIKAENERLKVLHDSLAEENRRLWLKAQDALVENEQLRKAAERLAPRIQEAFDRYSGDENMDNVKAFLEALEGK